KSSNQNHFKQQYSSPQNLYKKHLVAMSLQSRSVSQNFELTKNYRAFGIKPILDCRTLKSSLNSIWTRPLGSL
ncbi:hypothetical protein, partial [Enterobacter cloacae complex sp. 4DZ1-17B1]|uniref:hypothetical protein n=1 Tax=Enterobacter cloacae complex sp. 4DZ1-17B1 TaxID=2511991 RepID=UPI001CA5C34A